MLIRKTVLEKAGYSVLTACSGEKALQIFAANRVDVVVSDHLLPGATGTDLARQMKSMRPEIPIVLFSGIVDRSPGTEHIDSFVEKSEGPEKLLEAIAAVTGKDFGRSSTPFLLKRHGRSFPKNSDQQAATVVHEINNPLDSLANLLYLADAEPNLTDNAHHYLTLAREEVRRISQIANAALHGSDGNETAKDTDVPQLLRAVIDFYNSRLLSRRISIDTRCCAGGILAAYAGPLRQLFTNLLLNAVDAMPNGGRLHARVAEAQEWSGERRHGLRLTFADNGCGISSENLQKIFDPFFTTKGSAGSGLGLAFVKDVVNKHAGSLHVRSNTKLGHSGSVFAIFLPATGNGSFDRKRLLA